MTADRPIRPPEPDAPPATLTRSWTSASLAQATRRLVATLERLGWQLHSDHPKADDIGSRSAKDGLLFEVLAPDGLGQRTDLTTLPPLRTVPMTGGNRALRRTDVRDVVLGDRVGQLPVPELLGALIIKSRAATADRTATADPGHRPERHPEDLAVLYACANDLRALAADATNPAQRVDHRVGCQIRTRNDL